jgi:xanthine dehydrogenase small subunit
MRKSIVVYINNKRHELDGENAFKSVASYLRYTKKLTGTKVVCSEGDCGACTVILSRFDGKRMGQYQSINSCISFMYLLDKCHLVTVEGLKQDKKLHAVQKSMVEHHGAQCGYCTPGFICSMASLTEDLKTKAKGLSEKKIKNYTTGNLCRCTGYAPIIEAGLNVDMDQVVPFKDQYDHVSMENEFSSLVGKDLMLESEYRSIFLPASYDSLYANEGHKRMRMTSGATDLGVLVNKGKLELQKIVSLNGIEEAYDIKDTVDELLIGAKASLTDVERACERDFLEFSHKLHIFASPQIKNKGTLVGNLVNASPIGDSIPFLNVSDASVILNNGKNERKILVSDFFLGGYKQLDLKNDEIVTHISIPKKGYEFKLYKVSIRKDLDISTVSMAVSYQLDGDKFKSFKIGFGGVGPIVMRIKQLEKEIIGKKIDQQTYSKLAKMIDAEITPLSDLRGSDSYRRNLAHNLFLKFCDELSAQLYGREVEASL